jgi:MFS superfamily sulfate permease-like transporter
VLAAIVVKAMIGMLDIRYFQRLRQLSLAESNIALAAFIAVLVVGVLPGVGIGVVLSILALIYRASYPATAVLGRLPGSDVYRDVSRHPEAETLPGLLVFRFDAGAFFSNAGHFAASLERHIAEAHEPVRAILVDAESMNFVDATAAEMLVKLHAELSERGVSLSFARLRDPVRDTLGRAGLEDSIGAERLHDSISQGVEALTDELERR